MPVTRMVLPAESLLGLLRATGLEFQLGNKIKTGPNRLLAGSPARTRLGLLVELAAIEVHQRIAE